MEGSTKPGPGHKVKVVEYPPAPRVVDGRGTLDQFADKRVDACEYLVEAAQEILRTFISFEVTLSLRLPDYMVTGRGRDVRLFFRVPARGHEMHWVLEGQASRHHARK